MTSPSGDHAAPCILGKRYRLERLVATGGMAAVWRAHDELLARTVAVKLLHDHLSVDGGFRERFRREAVAAAKLTHPHIVGLYDTGEEGRRVWLVMEFVDGLTLRDEMDGAGPLDVARVAAVGEQVARALGYAHGQGLVHRDVKPANILLGHDGSVKVADFGIAKVAGAADDLTGTGAVLGTAAYVAPEQILDEPLDGACDQYALGCVLYAALTGRQPFEGDSVIAVAAMRLQRDPRPLHDLRPDLPAGLQTVVERALARHRSDRYPTADHLADELANFARRTPIAPAAPEPPRRRRRSRWPTPVMASFAVAAVLVVLLGAGVLSGPGGLFDEGAAGRRAGAVAATHIALFDPGGSGSEDPADLPALLDGDASTAWRTVGYNTPDFGNLKAGLGFWLDLGSPHVVESVALRTATPGLAFEVRRADQPAATLDGWQLVASEVDAEQASEVILDADAATRYLLVWITGKLQPDGDGRYRAELTDVSVRGRPQ